VEHGNPLELTDLIEVIIVGNHLAAHALGQLDQAAVYLQALVLIVIDDMDGDVELLLNAVKNIQTPAAAVALEGVGRIGNMAQLFQDKTGDDNLAVQEAGITDIGNAAVNDDAGIQNLNQARALFLNDAIGGCAGQSEHAEDIFAFLDGHHHAHPSQQEIADDGQVVANKGNDPEGI